MAYERARVYMGLDNYGNRRYKFISGRSQDERNDKIVKAYIESGRIREFLPMMKEMIQPIASIVAYFQNQQSDTPEQLHPFTAYAQEWYKRYKGHIKATTARTQRSWLDGFCLYFGDTPIESITVDNIQDYINSIQDMTTGNIGQKITMLGEIFNVACEDGLIDKNPTKSSRIKLGGKVGKGIVALSREEVKDLIEKIRMAEDLHIKFYLALMLYTGLRREEVLGLRWEDIDFEDGFLHVKRAVTYPSSKPVISTPKTKSSSRAVPIPDEFLSILLEYRQSKGYLIADKSGEPFNEYKVKKLTKAIRKYTGLPKLDARQLRHSYASMLHAAGVETKAVGACMGHTKSATTDRYIQVEQSRLGNIRNAGVDYVLS